MEEKMKETVARWKKTRAADVADETGPVDILRGRDLLVLADTQNLDCTARKLGYRVCWNTLGAKLDGAARSTARHAFLAREVLGSTWDRSFADHGWMPHSKMIRQVFTWRGQEQKRNI